VRAGERESEKEDRERHRDRDRERDRQIINYARHVTAMLSLNYL